MPVILPGKDIFRVTGILNVYFGTGQRTGDMSGLRNPAAPPAILDSQSFHNPAMHQMLFQDFVDIFPVDIGVPHTLRVNDDDWPLVTAIKASRRVDPDAALARDSQRLAALLGVITHCQGIESLATGTAIRSLVDAEKYVITVIVHGTKDTA